ncbi:MAG TPA: tetratricopeptide repeat protein [Vicinamibacterales bacterium]|nr:tetratricopeptide repeat protein [Vicinamibacterales bacterium]
MRTAARVLALLLMLGVAAQADALRQAQGKQQASRATVLQRAQQELTSGRRVEAKRLLADAADRFRSVQALLLLSRVQSEDGDAAGALESLRKARRLAPNSEEVLSAFAQMSLAAGAPVPAVVTLDALKRMSPSVMQYHYLLGVALMRVGDRLNAVGALQAAEQLEPNRALTLLALGIAHNSLQQYAEAKSVLSRAVELDRGNADTLAALAEAEQGLGELEAASKHVQQVLAGAPQHATANLVAGLVAMDRSQYAEARAALERAVQTDPLLFKAHYQLSLACGRLGDEVAASRYLEQYGQTLRGVQKMIDELRMATGPMGTDSVRR